MRMMPLVLLIAVVCVSKVSSQDKGRLSMSVYADYFYNIERDSAITGFANTAAGGAKGFNAFQFRRIYFTYDYVLASDVTTRFRLEADQSALTNDGKIGVFVKDAYVQWKSVMGTANLTFGIQPTPAFEVAEGVWGYRSVEKTVMDLRGLVSSRDFGVSIRGTIGGSGMMGYWLMVGNGTGNRPESDKLKRLYGHIRVRPSERFDITVYGDYSFRSDVTNPYTSQRVGNSILTTAGFLGITPVDGIKLGVEAVLQSTNNGFNTGVVLEARNSMALSGFATWGVSEELTVLIRYDQYDPNTHSASKGDVRGYAVAGVDWTAAGNVHIIPNIQIETYESSGSGQSFDPSLTGRLTIAWSLP